jgi:NAD-dependent SIR2 family protein deacetylase
MKFTENYCNDWHELKNAIEKADAILIGAGAGLSASAGFDYAGERFQKNFADFAEKYGIRDMYSGGFYPYPDSETMWAWWSRQIWLNRYQCPAGEPYTLLLQLVWQKNYFVLTTNVDHQFQLAGFDKERLFYTQGDYGLFQCSVPCHNKTYDNYEMIRAMVQEQKGTKIPTSLLPKCPKCGKPLTMNLRSDDKFVQDEGWYRAANRYTQFLNQNLHKKILLLELGVGSNTPGIIKYPFWRMTNENKNATYCCVNKGEVYISKEIEKKSMGFDMDIVTLLRRLAGVEEK